jgi:hypothetical protein
MMAGAVHQSHSAQRAGHPTAPVPRRPSRAERCGGAACSFDNDCRVHYSLPLSSEKGSTAIQLNTFIPHSAAAAAAAVACRTDHVTVIHLHNSHYFTMQ